MGSWFGSSSSSETAQQQPVTAMRVQTSIQGKPLALLWGQNRIAGNMIWYGDFTAHPVSSGGSSGGKGGVTGGGGKGQQGSVSYTYSASMAMGLCQVPIAGVRACYTNKAIDFASALGFEVFQGGYSQAPWGYLSSAHPTQALNYRGLAYVAQAGIDLGSSTELANYSFEVQAQIGNAAVGFTDANPRDVVVDFLTNLYTGVPGWPAGRLASMNQYATYCLATGLLVSPALTDPNEASAFLMDLFRATNASPRWSSGKLDVIPWGDQQVVGNGATYFPNVTPLYDLTNDDFLLGGNDQPITSTRLPPNERLNIIKVEFLDRTNNYDPAVVDDKDQASIQQYGERPSDLRPTHFMCLAPTARLSAHLQLVRETIPNTYAFTLPAKFILIDVEDLVTLTRPELALFRQAVRVTEITENDDGSLSYIAEEFMGTAGAPLYGTQATAGYVQNYNADPGSINDPILFEPTDELAGGLEVWAAVSGVDHLKWGGCNVYASYDGTTYQYLDRILGPSRMGVLQGGLAAYPVNPTGQTIDQTSTLAVDLSMSGATLLSGTQSDALALNTACYVDGEIIAYQTATLTGTNTYALTYLVRDAYGTEAQNVFHQPGTKFARLDGQILHVPYDQSRIGSTIYLKFQSFNVWGGGLQDIATLPPYSYVLTGLALSSPLPVVENVRTVFEAGFAKIWWDEITDFRQGIRYIVRKGDSYEGGQELGQLAHPPFVAFGSGTYWIMATCQPLAGLNVFGETPTSISIQGNMLTTNIVQTTDFQADGWPGTYTNIAKEGLDPVALLRLAGAEDFLTNPDVLNTPDVLNAGGIELSGTWLSSEVLNVYYVADCYVNVSWKSAGIPIGADILGNLDILNTPDILNAASSAFINVWVEIRTAIEASNDIFASPDAFAEPDAFLAGVVWGDWQRYVPGVYRAQFIQYRVAFSTIDPLIIAYLTSMTAQVSIPARIDHYIGNTVPTGGLTIVFMPDDSNEYKPFNGGTLLGGVNNHPLPAVTMDWAGNPGVNFVIDAISLSQMTFHFEDATGTHVLITNVDTYVEGY